MNAKGSAAYTPLHYAARRGFAEVAEVPAISFLEFSDDSDSECAILAATRERSGRRHAGQFRTSAAASRCVEWRS